MGGTPIPPAEGDSPSAYPLSFADASAPAEVRERSHWEARDRQASLMPAGETLHWGFLTKSSLCYIREAAPSRPSLVNLVSQRELRDA